jgi:hypothetical protein
MDDYINIDFDGIKQTSKTEYKMPNTNSISRVIFATHFISYTKQCVKNSIMAVYRASSEEGTFKTISIEQVRDIMREGNLVLESTIRQLNLDWNSFHEDTDSDLTKKINYLLNNGDFLHPYCCFNYIWDFIDVLLIYTLGRIDMSELRDIQFLSDSIDVITDAFLAYQVDNIANNDLKCSEECEIYNYMKNDDFIKTKRK